jgi:hypothetical protein
MKMTNEELLLIKKSAFHQLCVTTLANLTYDFKSHEMPRKFFSKDRVN